MGYSNSFRSPPNKRSLKQSKKNEKRIVKISSAALDNSTFEGSLDMDMTGLDK